MALEAGERYDGVGLRDLFRTEDGTVYEVVAIATEPTVLLREVGWPERSPESYVIRSPLFQQRFEQLTTARPRIERSLP